MAPNRDQPMTQSSTQSGVTPGATWPQAILFSGNFAIWPLPHEQQLCPSATLPKESHHHKGSWNLHVASGP